MSKSSKNNESKPQKRSCIGNILTFIGGTGILLTCLCVFLGVFASGNKSNLSPTANPNVKSVQTNPPTQNGDTFRATPIDTSTNDSTNTAESTIGQTLYVLPPGANGRSCAKTSCSLVEKLPAGVTVNVLSTTEGDSVNGNTTWDYVEYDSQDVYVSGTLLSANAPILMSVVPPTGQVVSNTSAPRSTNTQPPTALSQPTSAGATCPGFNYTCAQLTCAQAYACLKAGDSQLDANHDGIPCNSKCG